jgi:hypothetical protein
MAESNGRLVTNALEDKLIQQGYQVQQLDLNDEEGMRVYQVTDPRVTAGSKLNSSPTSPQQFYLHVLWSDRGTVYLRYPTLLSRAQLEQKSQTTPKL